MALATAALTALAAWWLVRTTDESPPPSPAPASDAHASLATSRAATATEAEAATLPVPTSDGTDAARTPVATGHVVRGTLRQNEAPLANVPLRVFAGPDQDVAPVQATTTASDGSFAFPMPQARFFFVVDAPTIPRDWWSGWQSTRASDWDLGDVPVPNGGAVTGVVRDPLGQPVANAAVTAAYGPYGYERIPAPAAPPEPTPLRTDAAGTFRIDGLRPGGYRLTAVTADRALAEANTTIVENGTTTEELELQRGTRVEGIVLDWRGQPLPGAEVTMESMPDPVTTDARGWFVIENHLYHKGLRVTATGHIEHWCQVPDGAGEQRIRLGRAVTLRGTVRGAGSAATTILLTEAPNAAPDSADARPSVLVDRPLPVAADGTFVVTGLSTTDFVVRAFAAGVGTSPPLRVNLREDTTIELQIAVRNALRVLVEDEEGHVIHGAEVVEDLQIAKCWSLYSGDHAKDVAGRIFGSHAKRCTITAQGRAMLPVEPDKPLALGVRCRGFLPDIRVFAVGEVPAEVRVVLQRAGSVRGVVHGGSSTEYTRVVALWSLANDDAMRALATPEPPDAQRNEWHPLTATVDAQGRFVLAGLRPGAWRAAVQRSGRASVGKRPDEQVGAVPLLDEGSDLRAVVEFTVVAREETAIALTEPPLGTLRGRVLLRGVPCADVQVLAVRPGQRHGYYLGPPSALDWDRKLIREWAAGQATGADGMFTIRYREAGPVELRIRHTNGAATSPPTVLVLPSPGTGDAACTLQLPGGAIRGRFPIEQLPPKERSFVTVVLYPMHKAKSDPVYHHDHGWPLARDCAHVELGADGRFAFDFLPTGEWLVRVHASVWEADTPPWQRVIHVAGEVVDLGDLATPPIVTASVQWRWPTADALERRVYGVWLYSGHGSDPAAVWRGTFAAKDQGSTTLNTAPGRYTILPFGNAGEAMNFGYGLGYLTGMPLAEPFPIEVHADGTVTPSELTFVPLPPPPKQR